MNECHCVIGREAVPGNARFIRLMFGDGETLEVPLRAWVDLELKIGVSVSPDLRENLRNLSVTARAQEEALRFLTHRRRTRQEIRIRLTEKGYDSAVIDQVLNDLQANGWVDDRAYAETFAQSKSSLVSRRELLWRLKQRGIDKSTSELVLSQSDVIENELSGALRLGLKFWNRHEAVAERDRRMKLAQYLTRRGYPRPVIRTVLQTILQDHGEKPVP